MKIIDVRTVLLTGRNTNDPYFSAARQLRSAAFIEIETDAGLVGLGETYAGYFCPEIVPSVVEYYKPILVGQAVDDIPMLWQRMDTSGTFWGRVGLGQIVLCGIESALWDLKGKLENKPVCELLGGVKHDTLPCYATGGPSNAPIEKLLDKIEHYRNCGFNAVKLGAGFYEPGKGHRGATDAQEAADLEVGKLKAVRERFGDEVDIALDAHMNFKSPDKMWPRETAAAVAKACEPFGLLFLEEALPYRSATDYAWLRKQTDVPIAGGECLTSMIEWQTYLDAESFDLGQPDAAYTSALHQIVELAEALEQQGCQIAPHAWGAGGCLMQNIHVGFACRNTRILELPPDAGPLHTEVYRDALRRDSGRVLPPTTPGLGIALTDELKKRFPFRPGSGEVVSVPGKTQNDQAIINATHPD